ncbi:hypothetical protein BX070DRAFT_14529 [Coemansia spiralis]|nr:hypothetical protein BX070DRAFT_14529 [Coemansia spiralis]
MQQLYGEGGNMLLDGRKKSEGNKAYRKNAMVRFGTNTQKSSEPAWQDVGANVLRMDSLYDATFHKWLKSEENVLTIAVHLQRIANEYPLDRIINALRWLVSSWRVESTAVIVKYVTSDWATPQNPPKPSSLGPFRLDTQQSLSLQSDPGVLTGEARRGVLVRELTKDWTSQQIAQLVSILALNLWCERTHLEAFIRTLVSDWDFCRLSSFFSYISNQLCLDYRVKVSMLQQAARRNASRLSLKRTRNGSGVKASSTSSSATTSSEDNEDVSNKRIRCDDASEDTTISAATSTAATEGTDAESQSISAEIVNEGSSFASATAIEPANTSAAAARSVVAECGNSDGAALSGACGQLSSQSSSQFPSTSTATSSTANFITNNATSAAANSPNSATCISSDSGAPSSLSMRVAQAGRMPAPLLQIAHPQHRSIAAAGATTTPSTPITFSSPSPSQPATASAVSGEAGELQTSSSSTDLTSIPYNTPLQSTRASQLLTQQMQQASSSASVQRRRTRNNTGSAVSDASSQSLVSTAAAAASCDDQTPASSILSRRPLTPQTVASLFIVHTENHHPSSPTLSLSHHRYNRRYQQHGYPQPLTPTHSSSSLSVSDGLAAAASMDSEAATSTSSASSLPSRQAMRHHAASVSSAAETQPIISSAGSSLIGQSLDVCSARAQQHQQTQQHVQQRDAEPQQDYRGRTASETDLGQFDGPASTHLASLPLPPDSSTNGTSICGRTPGAHYDVLGIVMESDHHMADSSV